jgi:hypothetical protein
VPWPWPGTRARCPGGGAQTPPDHAAARPNVRLPRTALVLVGPGRARRHAYTQRSSQATACSSAPANRRQRPAPPQRRFSHCVTKPGPPDHWACKPPLQAAVTVRRVTMVMAPPPDLGCVNRQLPRLARADERRSHLGYAGDPVMPDVSEVPATDHRRPGGRSAVCPPPMSECADGDARVVEQKARLVVG